MPDDPAVRKDSRFHHHPVLGVDIGSVSVALAVVSPDGKILEWAYLFHQGNIRASLEAALDGLDCGKVSGIGCTSGSPRIFRRAGVYDTRICFIEAAIKLHGRIGSLLIVGGEKFALLRFDGAGNFQNLKSSTSCAAGTGSFLDQQAVRLGLSDSAELCRLALLNRGATPKIASRCAVFAKTDLCHAQQVGYSLEEICDGLCSGLARNIADTVSTGTGLPSPVVFAGGVSRNRAVAKHLESQLGSVMAIGDFSHIYGAYGAALNLLEDSRISGLSDGNSPHQGRSTQITLRGNGFAPVSGLIDAGQNRKTCFHEPLVLELSQYPDFHAEASYRYDPTVSSLSIPVEVDIYAPLGRGSGRLERGSGMLGPRPGLTERGSAVQSILGFDIGSTSTKAVLTDTEGRVLAGFYTRTAGRPLTAVQSVLEALHHVTEANDLHLEIRAAGATGAGRKFVGKVIGSDMVINEITAHARAAYELNPATDTIIEIGGQDSKFTCMKDGMVTFSQMNTVCAAGTGSFIEEQAAKLGVSLDDFSERAEGVPSPLASDRCTVFMERDINHYLNNGYTVEEILAACLFSVRENYLLKVASEGLVGDVIAFQGATAKNRALVAAFEQKLKKPIFVSRYCHLTGALGVALLLRERLPAASLFRGVELFRHKIPVRTETCDLCTNHCRLRLAEVQGDTVAYGFLCGRDYDVKKFVSRNRSGFDLLREYGKAACPTRHVSRHAREDSQHQRERPPEKTGSTTRKDSVTVGLPAALHLFDELPLWKRFFDELSIQTVTSEALGDGLSRGKELTGAEFCAAVTALHGHVYHLAERCDYVFLPVYLEAPKNRQNLHRLRYYCYYTQFSPAVISDMADKALERKCLMPLVEGRREARGMIPRPVSIRKTALALHKALKPAVNPSLKLSDIARAYQEALLYARSCRTRLQEIYRREPAANGDVQVVLTGRPYIVLSPELNKGIPDIFSSLGIKTYFQDMLPEWISSEEGRRPECPSRNGPDRHPLETPHPVEAEISSLLDAFHWHYAAKTLEVAALCVRTDGLYPVLVTAFKCSPDSFAIEYFKRILDRYQKPYLILQIDEHDSSVGYETRIEAGIHSFRNHYQSVTGPRGPLHVQTAEKAFSYPSPCVKKINPHLDFRLNGKTLLMPNVDSLTMPLVVANLQSAGMDARLLDEGDLSIRKGMRQNTGQCIPINAITQGMMDYITEHDLDPGRVVLWMARSDWSCNFHLFPHYIKSLLESHGNGMEKAGVYVGELSHFEISPRLSVGAYFAYLFGGLLRRIGCRTRPYELTPGQTDRTIREGQELFVSAFRGQLSKEEALSRTMSRFGEIPLTEKNYPKVAIFGDFYVRDNEIMNQDLIRCIEALEAEVVTTPFSEYVRIIADAFFLRCWKNRRFVDWLKFQALQAAVKMMEKRFFPLYESYVPDPRTYRSPHLEESLHRFHVRLEHSGESFDNILKILHLVKLHPDITLFVQTNPAFCCPSLVTEAMTGRIEEITGVPVVTLTYDGTGTPRNDLIAPYLKYARKESK